MRLPSAIAAAVLLVVAPAASAGPREFLLHKILARARSVSEAATTPAARRRAALPAQAMHCSEAILARPVDVSWLTLSGDAIFFTDFENGLMRVPKGGGTPVALVSNPNLTFGTIVADANNLYYITADNETTGSIYSVPKSGGTPKLLATNLPAPVDMKVDSTFIYWLNLGTITGEDVAPDGSVERMRKDGSGRQKIVGNLNGPAAIDIDATDIFVTETGLATGPPAIGLRRVLQSGGALTSLIDNLAVFAIALSGSDVFYSGATSALDGVVARVPKSGGASQTLAAGIIGFTIVVSEPRVYIVAIDQDLGSEIDSVTTTGADFRTIRSMDLDSSAIAVDDCALYFAADTSLQRTAR